MGLPVRRLILATNENDVLDEFFRTGKYRVRQATVATSSPSMDISRASNFERYAFDLVEREGRALGSLWRKLETDAEIDLSLLPRSGFASGRSTHADRIATLRSVHAVYGVTIDPHTADGIKVGLEHRDAGVPLICLETALPAKFADTIREALGREPARPAAFEDLEKRPQRYEVIDADAGAVKRIIERQAAAR
jgi:threonine synthase